jgi:hypothetical protein
LFGLFLRLKGKLKRVGKCPRVWSKREEPTTGFPLWWREVRVLATVPQHWLDQAVGRRDPVTWPPSFSFYQSIIIKETPKELTEERKKKKESDSTWRFLCVRVTVVAPLKNRSCGYRR